MIEELKEMVTTKTIPCVIIAGVGLVLGVALFPLVSKVLPKSIANKLRRR